MELLIGCGSNRSKKIAWQGKSDWTTLVTLDHNPLHKPDVLHDLNLPLPVDDDSIDEIHAYEVLEHLGSLGDYKAFFAQFSDYWRVLKDGGLLLATVPAMHSPWLWGDPSHTRVINLEQLTFLRQPEYTRQVGITAMSDFRNIYTADFDIEHAANEGDTFVFILKAIKPSRCSI